MTTPVLPARPLQASLVGTAGPALLRLPDPEPEGLMLAGPGDASGHPTNAAWLLLPSDQGREAPWSLRPGTGKACTPPPRDPWPHPASSSPLSAPPGACVPPTHIPGVDVHVHKLLRVLFPRGTPPSLLLPNDGLDLECSGQEEGRGGGRPIPSASWGPRHRARGLLGLEVWMLPGVG